MQVSRSEIYKMRGFARILVASTLATFVASCVKPPTYPVPSAAKTNELQISALQTQREAFEARARGDVSASVKDRLDAAGVFLVKKQGDCVEFSFRMSSALDSTPLLLYAPKGRSDLPDGFWDSPGRVYSPVEIDAHWYAYREP